VADADKKLAKNMRPKKKKKKKKAKKSSGKNVPTNPKLYARVKAEAKRKFDVYPSAYANAWLVRTYKKRGGGYRKG
jgi:K+-transporting ATPase c subunit